MIKQNKTSAALSVLFASLLSAPLSAVTAPTFTDLDGDGVISAEEIKQIRETQKSDAIAEFDTDGDGQLSRAERKTMKQARKTSMIAVYDTDGDGELSRAERKAAHEARRSAIESQLDVNQDGNVSEAEQAGFDAVKEERGGRKGGHKHNKEDGGHHKRGDRADRKSNIEDKNI